ncbi:MAG: LCP family protein [Clostridia bacterium]|nr:LCP family protein [Clostridia bacterium]
MQGSRGERRARARRNLVFLALVVVILGIAYAAAQYFEDQGQNQTRGNPSANIGQRKRVEYQGKTYAERTNLTTLLLMGIDRTEDSQSYGARQGGQADFLLLMVIDHSNKTVSQLQIDRDTMTQVEVYGVLGNPVGTQLMQICLSHGFGRTPEENCDNAVIAVENLLEGIQIDYYMALNMDAIGTLNHALGGVTVTLEDDDLAELDPQMTKGATLHLTDEQAEIFLHSRMSVGEGTNAERMARHRIYMTAAVEIIRARIKASTNFAGELFDALEPAMTANIKRGKLLNEANQSYNYEVLPVATLAGEHAIGSDGFMEFHVAEGATTDWVMQTFYDLLN